MLDAELDSARITQVMLVLKVLKGSWRASATWHCVAGAGLESLKKAPERLLVKVQLSCSKGPQQSLRCWSHEMTTKNSSTRECGANQSIEDEL